MKTVTDGRLNNQTTRYKGQTTSVPVILQDEMPVPLIKDPYLNLRGR